MKLILSQEPSIFSICVDNNNESNMSALTFEHEVLEYPRTCNNNETFFGPKIVGSCRGLLCLNYRECSILWNPSTKTHVKIPEPENDFESVSECEQGRKKWVFYVVQGFGYDEVNDDFKVIRVYQYLGNRNGVKKFESKVLVYSLKSGSWKRVGDFPYFVHFCVMNDVFVNGALHFKVSNKKRNVDGGDRLDSDCMVVAFDVSKETYKVVTRLGIGKIKCELDLGVLDGNLCVVRNFDLGVSQFLVMKEYGVNSSWTDLFCVRRGDASFSRLRPISYLGDEKKRVLLEGGGEILCFDVESKSFIDFEIDGIDEEFEIICVCMESEVVLGRVDGNDDSKMEANDMECEVVLCRVDGNDDNKMEANDMESEVVLGKVDGNDDSKMEANDMESEVVLGKVDGNDDNKMEANDMEREVVLGKVDGNDDSKMEANDMESEVVVGMVDSNDDNKMIKNEVDVERVSTETDVDAT